jgi:hypothetical protein
VIVELIQGEAGGLNEFAFVLALICRNFNHYDLNFMVRSDGEICI